MITKTPIGLKRVKSDKCSSTYSVKGFIVVMNFRKLHLRNAAKHRMRIFSSDLNKLKIIRYEVGLIDGVKTCILVLFMKLQSNSQIQTIVIYF